MRFRRKRRSFGGRRRRRRGQFKQSRMNRPVRGGFRF